MINAVEDITIFNVRYDSTSRREQYIPTTISGVSVYRAAAVAVSGLQGVDNREHSAGYKIRIPITADVQNGRQYIRESQYAALSDDEVQGYWSIQKECFILFGLWDGETAIDDFETLRQSGEEIITVTEYSDNTRRGSDSVKHWRIGGT